MQLAHVQQNGPVGNNGSERVGAVIRFNAETGTFEYDDAKTGKQPLIGTTFAFDPRTSKRGFAYFSSKSK
jgi:hypothetical protein